MVEEELPRILKKNEIVFSCKMYSNNIYNLNIYIYIYIYIYLFIYLFISVQQISILEWFLKDHVTLKTGVITGITGINYIFN